MGWVIFLAIVAAIVALIVLGVKRKKRKRAEAEAASIEELKNAAVYTAAKMLKALLEQRTGYDLGEVWFGCSDCHGVPQAWGRFSCKLPAARDRWGAEAYLTILFSEYTYQIKSSRDYLRDDVFARKYGIASTSAGIWVYSDEECGDVPDYLKTVAEILTEAGVDYELVESQAAGYRRRG